ncbi:hypothetical protein PRK78_005429 [Emydomyces testavorans]|uniref:Uncharacterized protein n=1 Tax=Emydomyces testavorans TaxID=2070801 RepID=A0AAF0DLQ1_9EURO|nr:hypothetical protein PRK78_005429 [Emydomyces testavorans]
MVEFRDEEVGIASRLISTPIKANGAQQVTAQGIPQMATRNVAKRTDFAKANKMCEIIHAVCKSGRTNDIFLRKRTTPRGVLRANRLLLSSGGRTPNGRITELTNVINEKITSAKLPRRPTSPSVSFDFSTAEFGASYRKYVSPTQVLL